MRSMLSILSLLLFVCLAAAQDGTYFNDPRNASAGPGPCYGQKVYLPPGYNSNTNLYPLVVFLHGVGEKGLGNSATELDKLNVTGLPKLLAEGADFQAIILCPQSGSTGWHNENNVADLVNWAQSQYRVNPNKIILTGLSAGGAATWITAHKYPGMFSAVVPIAGNVNYNNTNYIQNNGQDLRRKPIWIFHSNDDTVVHTNISANWMNALCMGVPFSGDCRTNRPAWPTPITNATENTVVRVNSAWVWGSTLTNENPRLTLYAQGAHSLFERPSQNAALWNWMLAQTSATPTMSPILNQFIGSGSSGAVGVVVDCATTYPDVLKYSATSSDQSIVADSSLVFSGTGANRILTITTNAINTGVATITVKASDWARTAADPGARSVVRTFTVTTQTPAARIAELEAQLADAQADIADLTNQLSTATASNASLTDALEASDGLLNQIHDLTQSYDVP